MNVGIARTVVWDIPTQSWTASQQPLISAGTVNLGSSVNQGSAGASAWKVDGSAVTQPVSAASLPLPTSAATETTLGTRLSESDFDTKAGSLIETAPTTDTASSGLNGRLQRVAQRLTSVIGLLPSGLVGGRLDVNVGNTPTIIANAGTGVFTENLSQLNSVVLANPFDVDTGVGTQNVIGVSLRKSASGGSLEYGTATDPLRIDPTGTTTQPVSGTVTANAGTNLNTAALALDTTLGRAQASVTSGQTGPLIQGAVTTAAPAYTAGQTNPLSLTLTGGLRVDGSAVTQPVSGTITANAGTGTFLVNQSQIAGTATLVGNGVTGIGSQRVTIASDNTAFAVNNTQQGTASTNLAQVGGSAITEGQKTMATSLPVAIASDQSTVTVQGNQPAATVGAITTATSTITVTAASNLNVATVTVNGTYAGVSFVIEGSDDSGTTWYALQAADNAIGQILGTITPGTNATKSYDVTVGGFNQIRVRATAWTSGTANIRITLQAMPYEATPAAAVQGLAAAGTVLVGNPGRIGASDGTNIQDLNVSAKGTQGTRGLATQDLKDAGRTFIVANILRATAVTTEALASIIVNKGGTNQAAATSYTVTAGKTLRITGVFLSAINVTTATAPLNVAIRVRAAATVSATSPIIAALETGIHTATATLQAPAYPAYTQIPDGVEIPAGQQIGISHVANSVNAQVTIILYGFEY